MSACRGGQRVAMRAWRNMDFGGFLTVNDLKSWKPGGLAFSGLYGFNPAPRTPNIPMCSTWMN